MPPPTFSISTCEWKAVYDSYVEALPFGRFKKKTNLHRISLNLESQSEVDLAVGEIGRVSIELCRDHANNWREELECRFCSVNITPPLVLFGGQYMFNFLRVQKNMAEKACKDEEEARTRKEEMMNLDKTNHAQKKGMQTRTIYKLMVHFFGYNSINRIRKKRR